LILKPLLNADARSSKNLTAVPERGRLARRGDELRGRAGGTPALRFINLRFSEVKICD